MKLLGDMLGFRILLTLVAPLVLVIMPFLPDEADIRSRRQRREKECRRLIVQAAERGDIEAVREHAGRWEMISLGGSRPRGILLVLTSVSMTDREKMDYAAMIASKDP